MKMTNDTKFTQGAKNALIARFGGGNVSPLGEYRYRLDNGVCVLIGPAGHQGFAHEWFTRTYPHQVVKHWKYQEEPHPITIQPTRYNPHKDARYYLKPMTAREIYTEFHRLNRASNNLLWAVFVGDLFLECLKRQQELLDMNYEMCWRAERTEYQCSYDTWVGCKKSVDSEGFTTVIAPSGKVYRLVDFPENKPFGYWVSTPSMCRAFVYSDERRKRFHAHSRKVGHL